MKKNFALYESKKIVAIADREGFERVGQCYREISHKEMNKLEQQGVRKANILIPAAGPGLEDLAYGCTYN